MKTPRLLPPISLLLAAVALGSALSGGSHADPVPGSSGAAYTTVADEGGALQRRSVINLTGAGVTCSDDSVNRRTNCAITGGAGTVASVGLSLPAMFSVSGSPVTTSGTLAATLASQSANVVLAGPTSGGAAAPTFRSLVAGDLPTLTTGGDISGSIGSVTVNKIKNTSITLTSPAPVDVLLYSGSAWVNYPFSSLAGSSIQSIGTSNSAGSSGDFAQANHVHRLGAGSLNDHTMIAAGTITGNELAAATVANANLVSSSLTIAAGTNIASAGSVSLGGSVTVTGSKVPTINTATADAGGTIAIVGQHADDGTAQVRLDSSVTVTGQNVHTEIRNNGVRALGFGISGAINELGFYNSGSAGAFEGSLLANASTLRVYGFAAFNPYSDNTILLGGAGARWLSVGAYSYLGKHQSAATSGAVTITPSSGEVYRLLATGNVTSISIADGVEAQLFTLILVQKADGVPTWPSTISNCRIVGGTFTKSTGASKIDTITFRWDAGSSDWLEINRALDLS